MAEPMTLLARLCWGIDSRRWLIAYGNVVASVLFVAGCIGFYRPSAYGTSVTLFLLGSVFFLVSAVAAAVHQHGPST